MYNTCEVVSWHLHQLLVLRCPHRTVLNILVDSQNYHSLFISSCTMTKITVTDSESDANSSSESLDWFNQITFFCWFITKNQHIVICSQIRLQRSFLVCIQREQCSKQCLFILSVFRSSPLLLSHHIHFTLWTHKSQLNYNFSFLVL